MWATQNINKAYLKASFNGSAVLWDGSNDEYTYNGSGHSDFNLGTLTGDFIITYVSWRAYADWKQNTDFYLYYNTDGNGSSFPSNIKQNWNTSDWGSAPGDYYPKTTDLSHKVASVTDGSGNYDFEHYFYADFGGLGGGNRSWLSNGGSNYHFKYKILPPDVASSSIEVSATNTAPGSGTGLSSGSPIILISGFASTLTITASKDHTDANSALWCKFASGSYSSTTTYNIASNTLTSNQTLALAVKYRNDDAKLDGDETTTTIYYKWAEPAPAITMTSVTPSSSIVAGNDITLVGTRANSSNTISFQYTTDDGSHWTDITPKSSSLVSNVLTATWTVPDAHGATQTFKFRAKLAEATPIYSSKSSGVTVYNTKTIHVRNTKDWASFYSYVYDYSAGSTTAKRENWPGSTSVGISSMGGQWKNVVLTSQYTYFIFNAGSDANKLSSETYTYASSITDDGYYTIGGSGSSCTLSSASTPSAPTSVTTSAATNFTNTTARINGSIGTNGDDNITDYGFYWGTSSTPGTQAQVGTSNKTGTFYYNLTSLTAGTTYYYQAYATNGQGTTKSTPVASFVVPYSVTISTGTGCASISPAAGSHYMRVGDNVSATAATGYTFSSWSLSSVTMSSPSTSDGVTTSSITAAANGGTIAPVYRPNTYTIVFNKNNGSATGSMSDKAMTYNVVANLTDNAFELSGYSFIGWDTKSDGSGDRYLDGAEVINLTSTDAGTVNLYAQWAPAYTVTIAAKVSETTIPEAEYDPSDHTFTANTTLAVSQSAPTIAGYDFSSWTLDANLTSADATANPIAVTASATATLTANYTYHSYTVTYPSDAAYTFSANDASVPYKNTGRFTITPSAGYSIVVTAKQTDHPEVAVPLSHDGNRYSFTQGTEAVTIVVTPTELTNTITIVNGTTASTTAQVATATGTATAAAADAGMKFARWDLGTGITLVDCEATDRVITFHASQNTTITAQYKDRDTKTVHFAKPYGWTKVTAKFYQDAIAKTDEVEATATSIYEGATYYSFTYFVDNTGEVGGDQSSQNNWNKVVFSDNGDYALAAKTINNGYYYAKGAEEANGRTTPYAEWYLRGRLNNVDNWTSNHYARPFEVEGESATFAFGVTVAGEQYYRLYRISTGEWFRYGAGKTDLRISMDTPMTLGKNGDNADQFTSELGVYVFTLTNLNSDAPSLTVTHPEDTKYTLASISASAHGSISAATDTITQLGRYIPKDIEATADAGYRFKEWVTTGGAVVADPTSRTTTATATADGGTITATFTNEYIVYLDKSAITSSWTGGTPYVYFYSGPYWDKDKGSGSKNILWGGQAMTRIGATNIWYYDYSGTKLITDSKQYIAFTDGNKSGQDNFDETSVIYRADYYPEMNMYVPVNYIDQYLNNHDSKRSCYYEQGYWMKYNEEMSGYNLRIYDGQGKNLLKKLELKTATPGSRNTFTVKFNVEGAGSGKVELEGHDQGTYHGVTYTGTYYGNTGSIDATIANWIFSHGASKAYINFVSAGEYTFTLDCATDGYLKLNVTYPLATGDFRIRYNGLITTTDGSKGDAYSNVIPQLTADGTRKDTVSFFVTNKKDLEAALSLEKCTAISGATITWTAAANTFSGEDIDELETGVYVFEIVQTRTSGTISFAYNNLGTYSGNYYIRTDCAQGGWAVYKQADHIMHEPNYAGAGYDLYFCRYVPSGNVKFCIANKYSPAITKEIGNDAINATSGDGTLNRSANTRFEYVKSTNVIRRSYIGSSADKEFLYLRDAIGDKIYKSNGGSLLTNDTAKFTDTENWIYTLEVEAIPGATYKLEAVINGYRQYFIGEAAAETLVGGSGTNHQKMRLVFDYKNNHMIKAWLPNGVIGTDQAINADVMLIREGQAAATQLQFESDAKLTSVRNVYGVMGFKKDTLTDGAKSSARRTLYWISYPFDVKLKDIFGFGTYGEDYIIRRYNGALRAEKGWFKADGTTTFWETMDPDATMNAYEGYMLALDKGLKNSGDSRWTVDGKAIEELYLYFPSSSATVGTLSETDKTITFDSLPCRIDRVFPEDKEKAPALQRNHKVTDSNWRVIGVGSLQNANITATDLKDGSADFSYYAWDPSTNKLGSEPVTAAKAGSGDPTVFLPGHAIMIQWAGKLTWKEASIPASIAARRATTENKNYNIKLNLYNGGDVVDHTYVILQDNASAEFVMNEDLYKAMNSSSSNIYAFAGGYDCGISRIPLENTTVAIGVVTNKAGEYTFSMPNNFSGEVVLVDKYAQTRTNLNIEDYEVYLNKGTIDDRFELEININKMPTAIDGVEGGSLKDGKAHKFIENGVMYILRDGKIFDAQGSRVK